MARKNKKTRVIGVISGKGGVGKTTVASNIAAILTKEFKKDVVIVDCNITTSHLSLSLGMYYCPVTLNHVLRKEKHILESIYDHPSGMKIIPASLQLEELEGVDITELENVVEHLKGKTDYVILDVAPGLGREAYAALRASEEIILVTNPNMPAVADIIKSRDVIKEMEKDPLGVVLNMYNDHSYELSKKEVEVLTDLPVISMIPTDKNVAISLNEKMPVYLHKPGSSSSKHMVRLVEHLTGEKRESFLSKLLKRLSLSK
jgi:septum site-determining protein MinD